MSPVPGKRTGISSYGIKTHEASGDFLTTVNIFPLMQELVITTAFAPRACKRLEITSISYFCCYSFPVNTGCSCNICQFAFRGILVCFIIVYCFGRVIETFVVNIFCCSLQYSYTREDCVSDTINPVQMASKENMRFFQI